jgi:hypothetical protein
MNPLDLTPSQLKRAAAIKEQVERLNKELGAILGASTNSRATPGKKQTMSASVRNFGEPNQRLVQPIPQQMPRRRQ